MKFKSIVFTLIALMGVFMAQTSVNASTFLWIEQPKAPECLLDKNEE